MDNERFAEGFKHSPRYYLGLSASDWRTEKSTLINPASRWADTFSFLAESHLTGRKLSKKAVQQTLALYENDVTRQLLRSTIRTSEEVAFLRPGLSSHLNALNFHTMNQEMSANWWTLMGAGDRTPLDYIDLNHMQTRLSIQGLRLVHTQRRYRDRAAMLPKPPADTQFDESLTGQITEVDAAITLLEVAKQLPSEERESLVVVPSPPHYEGSSKAASDFLIFDTEAHQTRGIQVKTRLRSTSKYDEDFVSFIDGMADLQNYEYAPDAKGVERRRPLPGLIAADFILANEGLRRRSVISKSELYKGMYGQIVHAKEVALELFPEQYLASEGRVERAAAAIGPRILASLYERPDGDSYALPIEDSPEPLETTED